MAFESDKTMFEIYREKEFNKKFKANIPADKGYNTLGGFLYYVTGHIPELYERIDYAGFTFIIAAKQRNTIKQVKVIKNS